MYDVVIDIVKSIENIIKSSTKSLTIEFSTCPFSMKYPIFQIEIISNKMFWY